MLCLSSQAEVFPGSGVMCPRVVLSKGRHAKSSSHLARILLMGVFDTETLLVSSLKGGSSKRDSTAPQNRPLDSTKLEAIMS